MKMWQLLLVLGLFVVTIGTLIVPSMVNTDHTIKFQNDDFRLVAPGEGQLVMQYSEDQWLDLWFGYGEFIETAGSAAIVEYNNGTRCEFSTETGWRLSCDLDIDYVRFERIIDGVSIYESQNYIHGFDVEGNEVWRVPGNLIRTSESGFLATFNGEFCWFLSNGGYSWCKPMQLPITNSINISIQYDTVLEMNSVMNSYTYYNIETGEIVAELSIERQSSISTDRLTIQQGLTGEFEYYDDSGETYSIFTIVTPEYLLVTGEEPLITTQGIVVEAEDTLKWIDQDGIVSDYFESSVDYTFQFAPYFNTNRFGVSLERNDVEYIGYLDFEARTLFGVIPSNIVCGIDIISDDLEYTLDELWEMPVSEVKELSRDGLVRIDWYYPTSFVDGNALVTRRIGEMFTMEMRSPDDEMIWGKLYPSSTICDNNIDQSSETGNLFSLFSLENHDRAVLDGATGEVIQGFSTITVDAQENGIEETHVIMDEYEFAPPEGFFAVHLMSFTEEGFLLGYINAGGDAPYGFFEFRDYSGELILEGRHAMAYPEGVLYYDEEADQWFFWTPEKVTLLDFAR